MKKNVLQMIMMALVAIVMMVPLSANAEYTKPGTKFKVEGVNVYLRDPRHNPNDRVNGQNMYGFVEYENTNAEPVNVNWKIYGRMKSDKKLFLVDSGTFKLEDKSNKKWCVRKEVYSYGDGYAPDSKKGFDEFFVCVEVKKLGGPSGEQYTDNDGFTKPGTKFKVSNVSVQLFDPRHNVNDRTGSHTNYNHCGFVEYFNYNDYTVRIEWKVYGQLNGDKKVYKVDSGTISLAPCGSVFDSKKVHREIYNYGDDKAANNMKGFDKFYVSVKISKVGSALTDVEKEYQRLMKKQNNGTAWTQDDYASALKMMTEIWNKIEAMGKRIKNLPEKQQNAEIEKFEKQYKSEIEIWMSLGPILDKADKAGKLNTQNKNTLEKLKKRVANMEKAMG